MKYRACGRKMGKRVLQTVSVLQKFVLNVTSACSRNGAVEACCTEYKQSTVTQYVLSLSQQGSSSIHK